MFIQLLIMIYDFFYFRKIDVVDKIMDEINEQTQNKRMIQETLSAPTGSTAYFDKFIFLECLFHFVANRKLLNGIRTL